VAVTVRTGEPPSNAATVAYYLVAGAAFFAIAAVYIALTYPNPITGFNSDSSRYLFMADTLSPYHETAGAEHQQIAARIWRTSPFPPGYPLVLALFGAGTQHISRAHLVTTGCLLAALLCLFYWAKTQTADRWLAILLTLTVAALPGMIHESRDVLSENLFLLATLLGLLSAERAEVDARKMYVTALFVGLSVLVRIAGVALVAAFVFWLWASRSERKLRLASISLVPGLVWAVWDWIAVGGGSYIDTYREMLGGNAWQHTLVADLGTEAVSLWDGWITSFDFAGGPRAVIIGGIVLLLVALGLGQRLRRRKLDAMYVVAYLLMILLWPFPAHSQRFLFVVLPILVVYGALGTEALWRALMRGRLARAGPYVYVAVVLITVAPTDALIAHRFFLPTDHDLEAYRRTAPWIDAPTDEQARVRSEGMHLVLTAIRSLPEYIPKGACVYSTHADLVMLYGERMSYPYLLGRLSGEELLKRADRCRYFLFTGLESQIFPAMYPYDLIGKKLDPVFVSNQTVRGRRVTAAALGERRGETGGSARSH
jgi:hypothetical protein